MKLQITHPKAPWPAGSVAGDVFEAEAVPGWALGKCAPVADDAKVTIDLPPPVLIASGPPVVAGAPAAGDADQAQIDASMRAAAEQEAHELRRLLADAEAALAVKAGELEAAQISNAEISQKLADAEAALAAAPKAKGAK